MKDTLTYDPQLRAEAGYNYPAVTDSIFSTSVSGNLDEGQTVSLLVNHQMKPTVNGPQNVSGITASWVFPMTVLVLLIITLIRFYSSKKLTIVLSSVFSKAKANQYLRESNIFREQIFLPLLLVSFLSTGLYLYLLVFHFIDEKTNQWSSFSFLVIITLGFAAFFMMKVMLLFLSGWIFRNRDITFDYLHNLFIFNIFSSLVIIPFLLIIPNISSAIPIYLSIIIIILLFVIRFFRGLYIGMSSTKFSALHLFLYLCTLEILPYLVLAKLAIKYIFISA